jgi:hypothetical protein
MKLTDIGESVAGPESCWPGHRKVGTKPGTGKNAGKQVNDCEEIKEDSVAEGGFKNMYAEFSGYGNYMQGRAVNVFKTAGLEIVSKDYTEDDDIQTYVVKGDRQSIEKAGEFLERNAEQFGGYHFVKQGVAENYPKHQDLSGVSTEKLKAYLARQSQQSVPGEGSQVKRVQAELQRRSQGVGEGYQFKGPFPFDVDHMHGGRGINLPVADTRDLLQKPYEYYGNYKEWYRDANRVNSELLDDNAEYTTTAGGKTISINGKDFAAWSNRNGNGRIDIGIAKKHSGQGMAEMVGYNQGKPQALSFTGRKPVAKKNPNPFDKSPEDKKSQLQRMKDAGKKNWYAIEQQGVAEAGNKPVDKQFPLGTGDTRTARELKTQMQGASDEFVNRSAKEVGPFHSRVAKMQGKLAKSELRKREQGVAEGEYDSRKPFGVRYKVFAGREGRVTTKEYWTTSSEKLEKAVAKIEALDNFYEIDGYSYPKEKQGVGEGMMDNPGEEDSPVAQAIIRRILLQRTDLLAKHGPEKVGQAVDEVADFVGDVDEIGSSDVSGWVRHVEQMLGNMGEGVAEGTDTLNVGDDVIITGAVKYRGATGVVDSVGRDGNFIVVDLYNHGKQSFQSTDVSNNDYAGSEAEETEIQQRGLGESAPRSALGEAVTKDIKKYSKINEKMSDMEKTAVRSVVKAKHGKDKPTTSDVKKTIKFVKDKKDDVKEGAKVDRMVKHIAKSERESGKSKDEAEDIAWATANKRGMLDNKNKKTESTKVRTSKKY